MEIAVIRVEESFRGKPPDHLLLAVALIWPMVSQSFADFSEAQKELEVRRLLASGEGRW
jgi:hypothetical protein